MWSGRKSRIAQAKAPARYTIAPTNSVISGSSQKTAMPAETPSAVRGELCAHCMCAAADHAPHSSPVRASIDHSSAPATHHILYTARQVHVFPQLVFLRPLLNCYTIQIQTFSVPCVFREVSMHSNKRRLAQHSGSLSSHANLDISESVPKAKHARPG